MPDDAPPSDTVPSWSILGERTWTEKYRPATLGEVVGNSPIIDQFQTYAHTGEFPNMLLVGPPGTGKSAAIQSLARDLYGDRHPHCTLRLDGMNNRGADAIRERVAHFARTDHRDVTPRLLVIEQAEVLINDAQMTLRPLMERHTDRIRVVTICNDSSKIISGVQLLSTVYQFSPLDADTISRRLREIAEMEDVAITDAALRRLGRTAEGDARRAINMLQAVSAAGESPIQESTVARIVSSSISETVREMLTEAMDGRYEEAHSHLNSLLAQGVSGHEILTEAHDIAHEFDLNADSTLALVNRIGEAKHRLTRSGDTAIQISAMLADVALSSDR